MFEELESSEVAYAIELMAAMAPESEIIERFKGFCGKEITRKTLNKLSLRFAKQIREQNEAYLKNISGCPLSHARIRLDILNRIVEDSRKQRASHSVKITNDDYEVVTKADNPTAINALKQAFNEMMKREELDMEKSKLNDTPSEFEIDDGMSNVG